MRTRPLAAAMIGILAGLGATVLWTVPGEAQTAPKPGLQIAPVDISAYPQLTTTVVLPPELGGQELPTTAFSVAENGVAVPAEAARLPGQDLEVELLIDTSGSMSGPPLNAAKAAAMGFVGRMPPTTKVGVVAFSNGVPGVVGPLTTDRAKTALAIGGLVARGETPLYDAANLAVSQLSTDAPRRWMVVLSDGGDTTSKSNLDTTVARLSAAHVRVDSVSLVTPDSYPLALARMADAGGGHVAAASDPSALGAIYANIASQLADQYRLSYHSQGHGDSTVTVTVAANGLSTSAEVIAHLPPPPPASVAPRPHRAHSAPVHRPVVDLSGAVRLLSGAAAIFCALLIAGYILVTPRTRRARMARLGDTSQPRRIKVVPSGAAMSELASRATELADDLLERRGKRRNLNDQLERAGLAFRPGEFVVLWAAATAGAFLLGAIVLPPLLALLCAAVVAVGVRVGLNTLAKRRRSRFSDQLGDALQLLSGSLRAGYALLQALDAVAKEAQSPTQEEFRRIVVESRLGRDLAEALRATAERVGSEDFLWVVQAIEIHREVGGDLAEVLDQVAATIRERNQLKRQVKALTAEGRISAYILVAIPPLMALMLRTVNRPYFDELTHGVGLMMSGVAVLMLMCGALWLKNLVKLVY